MGRVEAGSPVEDVLPEQVPKSPQMIAPPGRQLTRRRRLLLGALGALVLAAASIWGIPWIRLTLNTISTDDAYVNGHVTFVAPRVAGQISRVLVDDNSLEVKRSSGPTRSRSTSRTWKFFYNRSSD